MSKDFDSFTLKKWYDVISLLMRIKMSAFQNLGLPFIDNIQQYFLYLSSQIASSGFKILQ